ncbi:MAG: transglycosylase SLT domain-containing protein [Luteitalea sp.]|nr:transglycosylase SLT domain-containing protein [Luteitalea sp.]
MRPRFLSVISGGLMAALAGPLLLQELPPPPTTLHSTVQGPLPSTLAQAWLVPDEAERTRLKNRAVANLAKAVDRFRDGKHAATLALIDQEALDSTPLAGYATYYRARAWLELGRVAEARAALRELHAQEPGALGADVLMAEGEAAMLDEDYVAAAAFFKRRAERSPVDRDVALDKWAEALGRSGETDLARAAWLRLYYELPTSARAEAAKRHAEALGPAPTGDVEAAKRRDAEIGRVERLFAARRYRAALAGCKELRSSVTGGARDLIELRAGQAEYHLGRHQRAIDALGPLRKRGSRQAEARFFHARALRGLNRHQQYVAAIRELMQSFPSSTWAEDGLNNLGTHYILRDEEEQAARTFRELYYSYPTGRHAARAAWKYGWWSYRQRDYEEAIRVFEPAASDFPRANQRAAWLYWSGRAREALGQGREAQARYELVAVDYLNSYYGQLAARRLRASGLTPGKLTLTLPTSVKPMSARPRIAVLPEESEEVKIVGPGAEAAPGDLPPALIERIRWLLAAELYSDAIDELWDLERTSGASPLVDATIAWALFRQGQNLRGVVLARRAYPHHIAVGGERLPREVLEMLFPLDYWEQVRRYANAHKIDPYLVAALISQESAFDRNARSPANAYGLMQVRPGTGRQLARRLGIRPFSTRTLRNPTANIRLGTRYFADLVEKYGADHLVLAAYNAGPRPVSRWLAERSEDELDTEEFIDDIPYPETRLYVKRVLGLRDVYRELYGQS